MSQIRLLNNNFSKNIPELMKSIGVDPYGIKIMSSKSLHRVIYVQEVSSFVANILKQELLSLGADAAIPKQALFKKTLVNLIIFATDSQLIRLLQKLQKQPTSLKKFSQELKLALKNFSQSNFKLRVKDKIISVNKPLIMGILNVTKDSFSGDGILDEIKDKFSSEKYLITKIRLMLKDGASIIDIGAESTRPGSKSISCKEEINRLSPVLKVIKKEFPKNTFSIDTYKPEVAKFALDRGVAIVNDITALESDSMAKLISKYKAGVILMHKKGTPFNMQKNPKYDDVIGEIYNFLKERVNKALDFGVKKDSIIIDPGIGFGKRTEDNLEIIKYLYQFKTIGLPILLGVSRKTFIGKITGIDLPKDRINGTLIANMFGVLNGANIIRVHDLDQNLMAIKLTQRIISL